MLRNFIIATCALCFLGLMAQKNKIHQTPSEHEHHNSEIHQGIITLSTDSVLELELKQGREAWRVDYREGDWVYGKSILAKTDQETLADYLSMLRNSKPVRTILPEEVGTRDASVFGLQSPSLETSIVIHGDVLPTKQHGESDTRPTESISISFGHSTPDGSLRYVAKQGDKTLYVMSGFIFAQALEVIKILEAQKSGD